MNLIEVLPLLEIAAVFSIIPLMVYRRAPRWFALVIMTVLLIPFGPLSLAGYIRGFTGDFSIVTVLLILSVYFSPPQKPMPRWLPWLMILFAAMFYAYSLGVGMTDPYAWGYDSPLLLVAILGVALFFWFSRYERITLMLGLAILAWSVTLHESTNLWDYVLDPYLFTGIGLLFIKKMVFALQTTENG